MKEIIRIKSIRQVHDFFALARPHHPLVSVIPIDDRITNFNYGAATYVFEFYQINLKVGFSGSLTYGRNAYDFEEGTLTFIRPEQMIRVPQKEEIKGSSGWTLLFHPDLIRKSELGKVISEYRFFDYEQNEALHLSEKEKATLSQLVDKIKDEYQQNLDSHSQELIISTIELILKYCQRFYDRQFYTRTNHNQDVARDFEKLLRDYYHSEKPSELGLPSVSYFSKEMGMSDYYLSDLLKKETGKGTQEHLHHYIIDQAKTILLNSNKSISQVAYALGYEYPPHFSKVFKNKTGFSPKEFRKQNKS